MKGRGAYIETRLESCTPVFSIHFSQMYSLGLILIFLLMQFLY